MYSQGVAQFYDLFADAAAPAPADTAFVAGRVRSGGTILDIGAGIGNFAFALAGGGYKVTALEPDPEMYAAMLVRLALRQELQGSLSPVPKGIGFELQQRFDLCLSVAVLHLLDERVQQLLFDCVHAHLASDGAFIIDVPVETPLRAEIPRQLKAERVFGATRYQHYYSMHRTAGGRWNTRWEFLTWRGNELLDHHTRVFDWKATSLGDVRTLAKQAGLDVTEAFSGFDAAPYVEGESRVLVAIARPRR